MPLKKFAQNQHWSLMLKLQTKTIMIKINIFRHELPNVHWKHGQTLEKRVALHHWHTKHNNNIHTLKHNINHTWTFRNHCEFHPKWLIQFAEKNIILANTTWTWIGAHPNWAVSDIWEASKTHMGSSIWELLNLQHGMKIASCYVWVRYFVWKSKGYLWNSTQNILPIHWKMCILSTYEILRALIIKSTCALFETPPTNPSHIWLIFDTLYYSNAVEKYLHWKMYLIYISHAPATLSWLSEQFSCLLNCYPSAICYPL